SDHDTALYLAAKPLGARLLVHVDDILARYAKAIANAVVAREVRGRFGRRDNVIGRQRVLRMRQRDVDDLRAGVLEPRNPLLPELLDFFRHTVDTVLLRDADAQSLDRLSQRSLIVRHGKIDRS